MVKWKRRWYGAKDKRIEEVDVPEVKLISQDCSQVYRNLWYWLAWILDGPIFIRQKQSYVHSGQEAPVTLGHEFVGEIVEVGSDVTRVKVMIGQEAEPILIAKLLILSVIIILILI